MIIQGDAQTVLKRMDDECIHMAVTSSPYYGLRSYGTEPIVWNDGWKGELGQEPSPEMFVRHLTSIFHELKRVLRKDGIFWMNIGDSYSGSHGNGYKQSLQSTNGAYSSDKNYDLAKKNNRNDGNCKPKDLIGIPWMLAFSMRADGAASPQTMLVVEKIKSSLLQDYDTWNDVPKHTKRTIEDLDEEWLKASKGGWYLRADIPWIKRNSMPSSVTSRPSSSIEHIFLFSKSGDTQFWSHPNFDGTRLQPQPDYRWKDKQEKIILSEEPPNWKTEIRYNNGEIVYKDGKPELRYKRFNLWDGHDYYYDYVSTMQPSSESYNKDKRPRGVIRQCVNKTSKYPDEEQFKKQDGTGNNTYTEFNDRYEPNGLGLRYMRDSDFFFKTWQGLLHNEDGEPMALVVNPKGYKGAHFACVDSETEALTQTGWKKYFDIQDGEFIAAYNNVEGNVRWEKSYINKYNYDGTLISIEKRDTSQLMTADHRCLVRKRISQGKKPAINKVLVKTADQLNSRMDLKMCAPWESDEYCEESIGITMASLVGWYITEGHVSKNGGTACISQSLVANPDKVKHIRDLLIELGADFKEYISRRTWRGRPSDMVEFQIKNTVAASLMQYAPGKHHPLTPKMINLPYKERVALLNAIIDGDGHRRKDGRISITQNAGESMNLFQALAVRCGYRTILMDRINTTNNNQVLYLTKGEWLTLRNTNGKFKPLEKVKYDGVIWCPTVESTFWVARRSGKTFITGNSYPVKLCEPLILAGTSEKGVCPKCGAPWIRITKRGEFINQSWGGEHIKGQEAVGGVGETSCLKTGGTHETITVDWKPTCSCNDNIPVSATVLDPFSGSSATGVACKLHNRTYIGIELNPEYVKLGEKRIKEGK